MPTLKEDIYQFRKSPQGMAIKNITKFKAAYNAYASRKVSSLDVTNALDERLDVRSFSAGGQARNIHMCYQHCASHKRNGMAVSGDLFDPEASSLLAHALIPPINDNELYGYRRPNIHYMLPPTTADNTNVSTKVAAAESADGEVQRQLSVLGLNLFDSSKKGHLYQYVRSVVLAIYTHEIESEAAMKDWEERSAIFKQTGTVSAATKSAEPQGRDKRTQQNWTSEEEDTVCGHLKQIADSFGFLDFHSLMRYIVEPADVLRDHFKSVVIQSLSLKLYGKVKPTPQIVKGIGEALLSPDRLRRWFPHAATWSPSTNAIQCHLTRQEATEATAHPHTVYRRVARRVKEYHPILPTAGYRIIKGFEGWAHREESRKLFVGGRGRLSTGGFTMMDMALCDRIWLEGWDAARFPERVAMIIGKNRAYLRETLHNLAGRYIMVDGRRVVDARIGESVAIGLMDEDE